MLKLCNCAKFDNDSQDAYRQLLNVSLKFMYHSALNTDQFNQPSVLHHVVVTMQCLTLVKCHAFSLTKMHGTCLLCTFTV